MQGTDPEDGEGVFEPKLAAITAVGQKTVVAGPDAERAEKVVADGNQQQPGPAEKPWDKSQRQKQMECEQCEGVGPENSAPVGGAGPGNRVKRTEPTAGAMILLILVEEL